MLRGESESEHNHAYDRGFHCRCSNNRANELDRRRLYGSLQDQIFSS